jgi:hypothetical protein
VLPGVYLKNPQLTWTEMTDVISVISAYIECVCLRESTETEQVLHLLWSRWRTRSPGLSRGGCHGNQQCACHQWGIHTTSTKRARSLIT